MDMSIVQDIEERVNANHVPDYIDDIFKYLKEMEVKKTWLDLGGWGAFC